MLIFGIQTVGKRFVDHGGGDTLFKVVHNLFGRFAGGVEVGFVGIGAQVGHHEVGHIGNALFAGFIFGINVVEVENLFGGFGGAQISFVDDTGTGTVDQSGSGLHHIEKAAVDHAAGFVVFGNVE